MTKTKSIKVSEFTYEALKTAAKVEQSTMQNILDRLLKEYQTRRFFEKVNKAYGEMSEKDWEEEIKERKLFEGTLEDGLEEEADETW